MPRNCWMTTNHIWTLWAKNLKDKKQSLIHLQNLSKSHSRMSHRLIKNTGTAKWCLITAWSITITKKMMRPFEEGFKLIHTCNFWKCLRKSTEMAGMITLKHCLTRSKSLFKKKSMCQNSIWLQARLVMDSISLLYKNSETLLSIPLMIKITREIHDIHAKVGC